MTVLFCVDQLIIAEIFGIDLTCLLFNAVH